MDLASKLEWRPYAKFTAVPIGSIAGVDDQSENVFIGRHLDPGTGQYNPGAVPVNPGSNNFGAMVIFGGNGMVKEVSNGEVRKLLLGDFL